MKRKGFTLIELLAVIVILAILALITVPIVLKLVNNARRDSAIRSAENYIDGVKKAVMNDSMNSEVEVDQCEIQTDGSIICNESYHLDVDVDGKKPTSGTINFSKGTVSDITDVRFSKYYINGEVNDLYATTKATIENRAEGEYLVGDKFTYKGERYYVIQKAKADQDYVVAMKMWPLSVEEVETYSLDDSGKTHVNAYRRDNTGKPDDRAGYGTMSWYSAEGCYVGEVCKNVERKEPRNDCNWYDENLGYWRSECGYYDENGEFQQEYNTYTDWECQQSKKTSSCPTSYDGSDVKVVVDNWAKETLDMNDLVEKDGYKARLLNDKEAIKYLKFSTEASIGYSNTAAYYTSKKTPRWASANDVFYWMMDVDEDFKASVHLMVYNEIAVQKMYESGYNAGAVRPVINLKKTAIGQ